MEVYNVNMPSKKGFDLISYIISYNGIIIALDKEGNSIGYILYSADSYGDFNLIFKNDNAISNEDVIYVSFEELFESNPSIESLKLIKFLD